MDQFKSNDSELPWYLDSGQYQVGKQNGGIIFGGFLTAYLYWPN